LHFLSPLCFLVLSAMPPSFDRSFGTAGPLGSNWLGTANVLFSPAALHHLVVSTGLLEASQAPSAYGHWRTKTSCKSDPTLQYWKSTRDLPTYLNDGTTALNPSKLVSTKSRLATLRADPVGCILLVVQLVTSTLPPTHPPSPIILLVAAPSLAQG
jgi:hypothetical protein